MVALPNRIDGSAYGYDNIVGTSGGDLIFTYNGGNVIEGGAGADIIFGSSTAYATDTASYEHSTSALQVDLRVALQHGGDAEGDQLYGIQDVIGSAFNDRITGDELDNHLDGGAGLDTLIGGAGNDNLFGGFDGKADILDGGTGIDTVDYSTAASGMTIALDTTTTFVATFGTYQVFADGSARLNGASGSVLEDVLRNMENVIGTAFNDTITGNERNNVIKGGAGADTINCKGGIDTIDYSTSGWSTGPGVQIDLTQTLQHGGDAEGDKLASIENIIGSYAKDVLNGDGGGNVIEGGSGDDIINGRGGNDTIYSGQGADILDGGAGADVFQYKDTRDSGAGYRNSYRGQYRVEYGNDTILNFETGIDKIDLRLIDAIYGNATSDRFVFADSLTGVAGQLVLSGGTLMGDVTGDGIADLVINAVGAQKSDILGVL